MAGALNVMSAQRGQIITDGLQLWLDPNLSASYPGSGTSVYDLSSNRYTATLVNGVTYSTARAPSFGFNGATNYRYIDTGQYISSETFTLSSWFKSSTTSTSWPSTRRRSTRCEPTKPAPPQTMTRRVDILNYFLSTTAGSGIAQSLILTSQSTTASTPSTARTTLALS